MRSTKDVNADKPNLQLDEQNITASSDNGDGVGNKASDANVIEYKCKFKKKFKIKQNRCERNRMQRLFQCSYLLNSLEHFIYHTHTYTR